MFENKLSGKRTFSSIHLNILGAIKISPSAI